MEHVHTPQDPTIAALAAEAGLTYEQFVSTIADRAKRLTVAAFIPDFLAGLTPNTARTYKSPLVFLRDGWSITPEEATDVVMLAKELELRIDIDALEPAPPLPRPQADPAEQEAALTHLRVMDGLGATAIEDISATRLQVVAKYVRLRAQLDELQRVRRRIERDALVSDHGYDGRGAVETFAGATRAFFATAMSESRVSLRENPASKVKKPRRGPGKRMPLTDVQFEEAYRIVSTTGHDPVLDELLFRFHAISAARREGALNLTLGRIDLERCTVILDEKDEAIREQPIPPSLCARLLEFAVERGATSDRDAVFRAKDGTPITDRHYDSLAARVQKRRLWAAKCKFDMHTLRVTVSARVEREHGYAVSEGYLGHGPKTPTDHYIKATLEEIVDAMVRQSGEDHPLRPRGRHVDP